MKGGIEASRGGCMTMVYYSYDGDLAVGFCAGRDHIPRIIAPFRKINVYSPKIKNDPRPRCDSSIRRVVTREESDACAVVGANLCKQPNSRSEATKEGTNASHFTTSCSSALATVARFLAYHRLLPTLPTLGTVKD